MVFLPHPFHVRRVVVGEVGAHGVAVRRVEGSKVAARRLHDQFVPRLPVLLGLVAEPVADAIETVGSHARDMLDSARGVLQGQGNGNGGHEVYVADVGEELVVVEGEFAEAEIDVCVGIGGVKDRGFHEGGPRIEKEGQFAVLTEPKTAPGDLGNGDGDGVAWRPERDGTVFGKRGANGRRVLWEIEVSAIRFEENTGAVVLDCDAGDVGEDIAGVGLVLESDLKRVWHFE